MCRCNVRRWKAPKGRDPETRELLWEWDLSAVFGEVWRLPPQIALSGESATTVTERIWEYLWLTPGRSLLVRLFVSSILRFSERRRMVLARVQDWASSAAVPFDGRPQGGGHLESTARVRAEGALDLSIRWAPVPSLEPITLRSNRPSAAAVRLDRSWTLTLCSAATTTRAPYPRDTLAGPNHFAMAAHPVSPSSWPPGRECTRPAASVERTASSLGSPSFTTW